MRGFEDSPTLKQIAWAHSLENACLLEWLIRGTGRRRLEAYVMFMSVQHERVAALINTHRARFDDESGSLAIASEPSHAAVWVHTFRDTTKKNRPTRSYRPTWEFGRDTRQGTPVSVQGLFREITDRQDSFEHDVLYGALGSDIVHSGPFSLLPIQPQIGRQDTFVLRPMPKSDLCTIALASSNMAMFLVLDSLTEYLGLDLSVELGELKATAETNPHSDSEGASSNG